MSSFKPPHSPSNPAAPRHSSSNNSLGAEQLDDPTALRPAPSVQELAEQVMQARQSQPASAGAPSAVGAPPTPPPSSPPPPVGLDPAIFLRMAVAQGVSDIHFRIGYSPIIRKDGEMLFTKLPPLTVEALEHFLQESVPAEILGRLSTKTDFDFSFTVPELASFRVNWFYEFNRPGLVLRIIRHHIPTFQELGLPDALEYFTHCAKGLVLVTGPTGSGKSTTLASMLNLINNSQSKHIITLEDPIEYIYHNQKSVITQRQLGIDTDTFPNGIKYALRQDPDIILVGEMRDRETVTTALHAAETGHMVFSTLHTIDSVQTINRVINLFEGHERELIRMQLASVLQGTISQRLVKRADGKPGRIAVMEILKVTPAIRDYIGRGETEEIYQLLDRSDFQGCCTMNRSLYHAYQEGLITYEDAIDISENKTEMEQMLRGFFNGTR